MSKLTAFLVVFAIALSGCHKRIQRDLPKTYAVTGKVVPAAGENIPVGARITFRQADPNLVAKGIVAEDGSFELSTLYYEQRMPGAAEGVYKAKVQTFVDHNPGPVIEIRELYTVEPKENHFTVKLDGQISEVIP